MKISTRLLLNNLIVAILAILIAVYSTVVMNSLSDDISYIAKDRLVKVALISQFKDDLNVSGQHARAMSVAVDASIRDEKLKQLREDRVISDRTQTELRSGILVSEGVDLLNRIDKCRVAYADVIEKIIQLVNSDMVYDATHLARTELSSTQDQLLKSVNDLQEFQQNLANQSADAARMRADQGVYVMALFCVLMLAVGVATGTLTVKRVKSELGAEPKELSLVAFHVANGDLSQPIHTQARDTSSVLVALARMQSSLKDVVSQVRAAAQEVSTASAEIASGNIDLSSRTESQGSALEQITASMAELGFTVQHNAENAGQANQLARDASAVAQQGGEVFTQVVATMKDINLSSKKIENIIAVIDGIAFQTNILALNAAVEAARAGEQGRGFAVVAGEVRALASRSADAAKEIKSLITASVERVEQGCALVDQVGVTMQEVVQSIGRVSDIVGEISIASSEQSQGVHHVAEAVTQMDGMTQQNAAMVEEISAAASSLRAQAQELVHAVSVFKLNDEACQIF